MRTSVRVGAAFTAAVVGAAISVIGSAGAAFAATQEATETSTVLPFGVLDDMVVDTTTGHIFVSGGNYVSGTLTSTYIEVLNLAGQIVGQIQDQDDATGLALSPDGSTLYAADAGSDSIAVIDASTLTQTTSYAAGVAPQYVAVSGGNLWFTTNSDEKIHEVALSTGAVATTNATTTYYGSDLVASSAAANVLVSGTMGLSPTTVDVFDVSSGAPVLTTGGALVSVGGGGCANLGNMVITPDGQSLDMACGSPYEGFQVSLSAVTSVQQTYDSGAYPRSIAVSPDGETLVGTNGQLGDDTFYEFAEDSPTPVAAFAVPEADGPTTNFVAWGASDSVAYAITQGGVAGPSVFETFDLLGSVDLTVSVPSVTFPHSTFTVGGRLTANGSALSGMEVRVTRSSAGATSTVGEYPTDANGDFSFTDSTSTALTTTTYTATLVGVVSTLTASGTITTVPVKVPVSKPPVRTPVKAVSLAVRR
ncbi:MAG TPA: hypothetical protein VL551_01640 [Actinospica sp.]|jgi:YVTN family beta-propeller protein|nr:hypothetical protein [Actinospica sp.]